ncbi:degenerin deg-1-like [Paramuricea clavata]|uniref:Degenerin deg-1-like n=1 Tax=Paramuricea clavata TaxID=317549 RepID=A0A7D9EGX7_PARCT|nr:degenerin deg-1-like [Paramuricea clavata]
MAYDIYTVYGTCLKTVKYLFNNDRLSCLADCRQPCKEEVIQKTISSSQWPSKAYKDYLISQKKYHNESDNMLQLNVFFNELNYEKIEEQFSYGTINLLADVGGQLGLWIGISVITVCELLELIVMFFAVCIKKINAVSEVHEVPAYG